MKRVIVTGGDSGLGKAIVRALHSNADDHLATTIWSMTTGVDVRNKFTIQRAVGMANFQPNDPPLTLINCAGENDINYIPDVKEEAWDRIMDTNAKGIFLCTQALLEPLRGGTVLNIVSNASHVPMTSSIAYNASKGAAAIMTQQMARELGKTHNITVFGISPNKLAGTAMSAYIDRRVQEVRGWTAEKAREYQLAALPAGEETDPDVLAEFIAFLLFSKRRHKYLQGCILPYGV